MMSLILMSLLVTLGFFLGSYWVKSGETAPITREQYNRILATAFLWYGVAYEYFTQGRERE